MPICDGCGFSFDDSFKFCPQCGRAKPETPKMKLEVEVKGTSHDFDCPLCDDASSVQKVSAIVGGSTSVSEGRSTSSGSSSVYAEKSGDKVANAYSYSTTSSYNKSQTELAKKLTLPHPPQKPLRSQYSAPGCWSIGAGIAGAALAIFILSQIDGGLGGFLSFLVCSVGVGGPAVIAAVIAQKLADSMNETEEKFKSAMKKYQHEADVYAGMKAEWDQLYYCHKHDVVYTTTRREAVPVDNAIDACYLWAHREDA